MNTPIRTFSTEILVPFHDCDPMNIVWHGSYVKYLEVARCELLDSINYNYIDMHASGFAWPVVDMRLKYIQPLRFNQRIVVHSNMIEWEHRLKISYEICDATTGQRMSKAHTVQMAVNMETDETCFESPAILLERLGVTRE